MNGFTAKIEHQKGIVTEIGEGVQLCPKRRGYVAVDTEFDLSILPKDQSQWAGFMASHLREVATIIEQHPTLSPAKLLEAPRLQQGMRTGGGE